MIEEIWKDIDGYEGLYQVSNLGQVKSLERVVIYENGRKQLYPEKILKLSKDKDGYLQVTFSKNRKLNTFKVHQLVARTFVLNDNPIEKTQVNHLDENKENNHVDNLCWCNSYENNNYGTRNERVRKARKGKPIYKIRIPIVQLDLQNNFIKNWDSAKSVSIELNIDSSSITKCCKGKLKTYKGYKWVYKSDYKPTYTQLEMSFID